VKAGERLKIWWRGVSPSVTFGDRYEVILQDPNYRTPRDRFWAAVRVLKGVLRRFGGFLAGVAATLAAMAIGKWLGLT
jgi:hypothetical protein